MKTKVLWILGAAVLIGAAHIDAATVRLFAGGGSLVTGPATQCRLADPFAIEFDSSGNAFLCEMTNNRVLKVDSSGVLTVIGGNGTKGSDGDGRPASKAQFNGPHNLAVGRNGDVFVADTWNWKIRRIEAASGIISTFAGTGKKAFGGDGGPAEKADFSGIYSIAFDASHENLYVVDLENRRVRAIDLKTKMKIVRTIAGNGMKTVPANDSIAANAPLFDPRAVAVSDAVYILERGGNALRAVDLGKIRTVVGTGKAGPWTPTENPLEAELKGPKHLCVDKDGNVLIADSDNHVIRKYLPKENKLVRVAGTGKAGRGLNSDPLKTELNQPHGVSVDSQGRIYVSDSSNSRVLRIEP